MHLKITTILSGAATSSNESEPAGNENKSYMKSFYFRNPIMNSLISISVQNYFIFCNPNISFKYKILYFHDIQYIKRINKNRNVSFPPAIKIISF